MSSLLLECKIKQASITRFVYSPAKYAEFDKALSWIQKDLRDALGKYSYIRNQRGIDVWKRLEQLDKFHPDMKMLEKTKKNVRRIWTGRPRFK
jgi:hypothetical protein